MNTYVNFSGTCAEPFRYYEKHLGAKVGMMMTHAQAPDQSRVNPEWKDSLSNPASSPSFSCEISLLCRISRKACPNAFSGPISG
jgi:hypothetical protein